MLKSNNSHHLYGFTDLKTLNARGPVVISHGKGIYVYDIYDKPYLWFFPKARFLHNWF